MYISRHMTPAPLTVEQDILISEAREILRSNRFRHLPVIDKDWRLVGMVTDRDIRSAYPSSVLSGEDRRHELEQVSKTPVSEIMSTDLVNLFPYSTIDDALLLLEKKRVGAIPVLDEKGVVVGIFSVRDLMRAYSRIFGLAEKGGSLITIKDDGEPDVLARIVNILEQKGIPLTRLSRTKMTEDEKSPGIVYIRVQTYNISAVHSILADAGFELVEPEPLLPEANT
ncbi:MAG: acetoin utilization protein AcuB [Deltaproteobacteria bacterium]|nr:MAG: acetoin utilization protein AcuB [Deltaproteobacteria bacterium]